MRKTLLLIDGNSVLHRTYWALPALTNAQGVHTNAVFGFMNILLKLLRERRPDYVAVAFDTHAPTFRHQSYEHYKEGRRETPPELISQFPLLREILSEMGIKSCELDGFEADDIIGTLSRLAKDAAVDALIVTGDRDAFQLIGDGTKVLFTKKGVTDIEELDEGALKEGYAVTPAQVIDLKALMGDKSDNIPGVQGVGEKRALALLAQYGTLDGVLEHADGIPGKLGESIRGGHMDALKSRLLATIRQDVPLDCAIDDLELHDLATPRTDAVLSKYALNRVWAGVRQLERRGAPMEQETAAPARRPSIEWQPTVVCEDAEALKAFAEAIDKTAAVVFGEDITIAVEDGRNMLTTVKQGLLEGGIEYGELLSILSPWLSGARGKILHDAKGTRSRLIKEGAEVGGVTFDTAIAAYLIAPQAASYALGPLCESVMGEAREDARALYELHVSQRETLKRMGMDALYNDIELPLSDVLLRMEREGFRLDTGALRAMQKDFAARIRALQGEVFAHAGMEFNINSTKQLAQVLFERLGLPAGKKTKSGYSTDADVLQDLSDTHPIIPAILEYRSVVKLQSTYIEGLLGVADATGRVRTTFQQTVTATGRISSAEPNLQNIPVRTEMGREIRKAFIPSAPGNVLVDADYSQIELRVLAHMSGDESMREAFLLGQDIHRRTASEVYGVPMDAVTGEMRSAAKAINFGIVYGISDFGLARNTGISRTDAKQFIERYFERYPKIRAFMDECVDKARATGYAETMCGRRRPIPELASSNYQTRAFGERAAMNTPIQGTAADIIKLAMVRADEALRAGGFKARLILQVHDELIFDTPKDEQEAVVALARDRMENALPLSVPLSVDINVGGTWFETK